MASARPLGAGRSPSFPVCVNECRAAELERRLAQANATIRSLRSAQPASASNKDCKSSATSSARPSRRATAQGLARNGISNYWIAQMLGIEVSEACQLTRHHPG